MQNAMGRSTPFRSAQPRFKQLRLLPANLLTGNAGGISHPVIEPYVLPLSPYEAFTSGQQNDVPLLIGSNADEARAMIDVTHETAATFDSDMEHSVGQLPPPLLAAYPHATDEEAKQARLGLERDLRFGWDMWAWARLQAATGQKSVYYYLFQQQPPFPAGSVYEGWGASHFAELWYVFDHLDQEPWRWSNADRRVAEEMSSYWVNFAKSGNPNGPDLPLVACVHQRGEQSSVSGRSDHRGWRGEYQWPDCLRCRLRDGPRQALCRTVTDAVPGSARRCRFTRFSPHTSRDVAHERKFDVCPCRPLL